MQRTKSLFARKIRCQHCGKNFKSKKERAGKIRYVCSSYDLRGECIRNPVKEEFLIELLEKRLNQEVTRELVDDHVDVIVVEGISPYLLEIHMINQDSILFSRDGIRF